MRQADLGVTTCRALLTNYKGSRGLPGPSPPHSPTKSSLSLSTPHITHTPDCRCPLHPGCMEEEQSGAAQESASNPLGEGFALAVALLSFSLPPSCSNHCPDLPHDPISSGRCAHTGIDQPNITKFFHVSTILPFRHIYNSPCHTTFHPRT